ncbi:MAG: oxidoreductase [Pseudomonadota bacterium]
MSKLKVGIYWAAACGGCDVAILDIHEKVLAVNDACEFLIWPLAMDFKYADAEALPDGQIDLMLFNGAIRNSENLHLARLLRRKSKVLVAFGSCAHTGGIPALANLFSKEEIFHRAYVESPSTVNPERFFPTPKVTVPEGELELPEFFNKVFSLDQVVDVDYYVPGCPPNPERIWEVLEAVVSGATLPPPGAVLGASEKSLCDTCERTKSEEKIITGFRRMATTIPDPEVCFLDQGIVCLGPVTRDGCGQQCVGASSMPCRGCYGLPPGIEDQGAGMIASLGSLLGQGGDEELRRIVATLPDPAGTFYRFSLSTSLLERRKDR